MQFRLRITACVVSVVALVNAQQRASAGTPFVPGAGDFLSDCCDDFEDTSWSYRYNHPKSSHEQDEQQRGCDEQRETSGAELAGCPHRPVLARFAGHAKLGSAVAGPGHAERLATGDLG